MIPILFESTASSFTTNGLGALAEAISCEVTEERNEGFELELKYPISGIRFNDIKQRRIIYAKPSPARSAEPFRIYKITKPSKGIITVYAQHISYDLSGIPVTPFSATTAAQAISRINTYATVQNNFQFSTDMVKNGSFEFAVPSSIRSIMGGRDGSILDVYHGEWQYSGFNVALKASRGRDNGVKIAYGKNLTTLEQEENISAVYTGVLPYYYSESDGLVQGQVQNVPGTFDFVRILTYDFSDKFDETPTVQQLNAQAVAYIEENDIGVPAVSLKVSFADLSKASGFGRSQFLETVELCDTVTVDFDILDISATAKVVKTTFDVLLDKYSKIEIGQVKDGIASTIAGQAGALRDATTKSDMEKAIAFATQLITGATGGYVVMHDSDGDKKPDEILIMDTDDIETATKVWRWNKNGLGYSSSGYAGPYGLAMTINGAIVADYIKTGTLNASNVNVENINGANIRDLTIAANSLASGVQGTLSQVGVNASNIVSLGTSMNAIYAEIHGSLQASALAATFGSFTYIGIGGYDAHWSGKYLVRNV